MSERKTRQQRVAAIAEQAVAIEHTIRRHVKDGRTTRAIMEVYSDAAAKVVAAYELIDALEDRIAELEQRVGNDRRMIDGKFRVVGGKRA